MRRFSQLEVRQRHFASASAFSSFMADS